MIFMIICHVMSLMILFFMSFTEIDCHSKKKPSRKPNNKDKVADRGILLTNRYVKWQSLTNAEIEGKIVNHLHLI